MRGHTARRIWQRLVDERGTQVAEPTVRAYMARVRRELESGRLAVTVPQRHPPEAEAEVDFGRVSVWLDGVLTELSMFVMRLSHSGRAVHVCSPSEGQEPFLEGHQIALEWLCGVSGRVRYDNLKAAVVRVLAGREWVESDRFTALCSHFGFDAFFCAPGIEGVHEQGGVEGEVGRFRLAVPQIGRLRTLRLPVFPLGTDDPAAVADEGAAAGQDNAREQAAPPRPLAGTIRRRYLKVAVRVRQRTRRILLEFSSAYPYRVEFVQILGRLMRQTPVRARAPGTRTHGARPQAVPEKAA